MERILVVEDDRAVQKALKRLFEAEGFAVEISADGKSALDAYRAATPSAVVLDLRLPAMQNQIREHRTLPWTAERDALFPRANLQRAEHEKRNGVVRHDRVRRRYSSSSRKYRAGG